MSDKLTEKKLKELIREVLQEKKTTDFPFNADTEYQDVFGNNFQQAKNSTDLPKTDAGVKDRVKKVAALAGSSSELDIDDLQSAAAKKKNTNDYKTVRAISNHGRSNKVKKKALDALSGKTTKPKTAEDPMKMGKIKGIDMKTQIYEPRSMAFGQMANIGSQSDPKKTSALGQFPEGLAASVNAFFKGKSTFASRVEAISKFSETIAYANKFIGIPVNKLLAGSLFLDYLTTIVTEMDSGTGAYQLETLLSVMSGGKVTGKGDINTVTGASTSGQMGAVDFVMNDGTLGSSKYYSNVGKGKLTQAFSGFKNQKGKSVLYIIAHKKGVRGGPLTVTKGTSDPTKIISLNIYLVSVMPTTDTPTQASDFSVFINGKKAEVGEPGGSKKNPQLDVAPALKNATPIELKIAGGKTNPLKDQLQVSANKSNQKIKNSFDYVRKVFSELYTANQKIQRYVSANDKKAGNDALTSLETADDRLIDLAAELNTSQTRADIAKSRTIKENKTKSKKDLDKLIEAVILETLRKK
jgi:hypothetical protein